MANKYYLNNKQYRQEIPLGVSGSIKIRPGEYVRGDSFASLAAGGFLYDAGASEPAAVTADPSLLIYEERVIIESETMAAGDGIAISGDGEISATVVEITAGDGITVTPTDGTYEIAADVVDIAAGTGISVTPADGTYTIALATPPTVAAKATDGAITVGNNITYFITKGSALGSSTLATPTATTHDGYTMTFVSTTGFAHVISVASGKVNGGTNTALTFDTNVGSHISLVAYQGVWYTTANVGVTIS